MNLGLELQSISNMKILSTFEQLYFFSALAHAVDSQGISGNVWGQFESFSHHPRQADWIGAAVGSVVGVKSAGFNCLYETAPHYYRLEDLTALTTRKCQGPVVVCGDNVSTLSDIRRWTL